MSRREPRILFVVHNHPALHPGGAEAYALELYRRLRDRGGVRPTLVARIGPNRAVRRTGHPGTPFSAVDDDPDQYFVFTETERFDFFRLTSRDKDLYSRHFADFLDAHRPDVVHVQHTLFVGYELLTQIRRSLPHVPIVYTLHEYLAICHRDGQMVRTADGERCLAGSPRRCNECFPAITPQEFFLRKRFIEAQFDHVDLFLAPSRFLMERYVAWGIPRDRIRFEEYGRLPTAPAETSPEREGKPHVRLGFFGQMNHFKGIAVLLEAMALLAERLPDVHLTVHGANLELQGDDFQERVKRLLEETRANVTFAGPYEHRDLPGHMAAVDWVVVPSIWWENSPLVIQEAFQHGRPVICSDVGGMAEKVTDGVDGLHFRAGDPRRLADTIERAATEEGLWENLRAGIRPIHHMDEHVETLTGIYRELLERRALREVPA